MPVHASKGIYEVGAQLGVHILGQEASSPLSVLGPVSDVADQFCRRAWPVGAKQRNGNQKGLLWTGTLCPEAELMSCQKTLNMALHLLEAGRQNFQITAWNTSEC